MQKTLVDHKVGTLIDPSKLMNFKSSRGENFSKLSIPQVGKALGAKQIIYGDLVHFNLESPIASNAVKGSALIQVRVKSA